MVLRLIIFPLLRVLTCAVCIDCRLLNRLIARDSCWFPSSRGSRPAGRWRTLRVDLRCAHDEEECGGASLHTRSNNASRSTNHIAKGRPDKQNTLHPHHCGLQVPKTETNCQRPVSSVSTNTLTASFQFPSVSGKPLSGLPLQTLP